MLTSGREDTDDGLNLLNKMLQPWPLGYSILNAAWFHGEFGTDFSCLDVRGPQANQL